MRHTLAVLRRAESSCGIQTALSSTCTWELLACGQKQISCITMFCGTRKLTCLSTVTCVAWSATDQAGISLCTKHNLKGAWIDLMKHGFQYLMTLDRSKNSWIPNLGINQSPLQPKRSQGVTTASPTVCVAGMFVSSFLVQCKFRRIGYRDICVVPLSLVNRSPVDPYPTANPL